MDGSWRHGLSLLGGGTIALASYPALSEVLWLRGIDEGLVHLVPLGLAWVALAAAVWFRLGHELVRLAALGAGATALSLTLLLAGSVPAAAFAALAWAAIVAARFGPWVRVATIVPFFWTLLAAASTVAAEGHLGLSGVVAAAGGTAYFLAWAARERSTWSRHLACGLALLWSVGVAWLAGAAAADDAGFGAVAVAVAVLLLAASVAAWAWVARAGRKALAA